MIRSITAITPAVFALALFGALFFMVKEAAGQKMSEQERNRALVAHGFANWASGSGSPYDLLADDARWTITGNSLAAKTYPSKEVFMSEVIRPFNARMRDRPDPQRPPHLCRRRHRNRPFRRQRRGQRRQTLHQQLCLDPAHGGRPNSSRRMRSSTVSRLTNFGGGSRRQQSEDAVIWSNDPELRSS